MPLLKLFEKNLSTFSLRSFVSAQCHRVLSPLFLVYSLDFQSYAKIIDFPAACFCWCASLAFARDSFGWEAQSSTSVDNNVEVDGTWWVSKKLSSSFRAVVVDDDVGYTESLSTRACGMAAASVDNPNLFSSFIRILYFSTFNQSIYDDLNCEFSPASLLLLLALVYLVFVDVSRISPIRREWDWNVSDHVVQLQEKETENPRLVNI